MGTFPLNGRALLWNRAAALAGTLLPCSSFPGAPGATERRRGGERRSAAPPPPRRSFAASLPFSCCRSSSRVFSPSGFARARRGARDRPRRRLLPAKRRRLERFVPPRIARIDLRIDLEPDERRMALVGAYELENATAAPMARLPFTLGSSFGPVEWSVEGAARGRGPVGPGRAHPRAAARAGRADPRRLPRSDLPAASSR